MTLRFGDEKSLMNTSAVADLTADMLMRGTAKHSARRLKDELDRLKARVSIAGGPTQATVSVETIRDNLPAALALVAEMLREPRVPRERARAAARRRTSRRIEQQRTEPSAMASNAFSRHANPYPKGDVRYVPTPQESTEEYKARDARPGEGVPRRVLRRLVGELAIVGDFDADACRSRLPSCSDRGRSRTTVLR